MKLANFKNRDFDRGANPLKELMWIVLRAIFFNHFPFPTYGLRRTILSLMGGHIGQGVIIKPTVNVTFPWKLSIGDHCWIGEQAWLMNLSPITIGNNVCISQRAYLCGGNHDWSDPAFRFLDGPITIGDGVWICAQAFIGPGVTVGENSVVTAGSVVTNDLPANMICAGNPCVPVKPRDIKDPDSDTSP
jgi:putative colanic acid biosynthesis acetyltransferase WcaF